MRQEADTTERESQLPNGENDLPFREYILLEVRCLELQDQVQEETREEAQLIEELTLKLDHARTILEEAVPSLRSQMAETKKALAILKQKIVDEWEETRGNQLEVHGWMFTRNHRDRVNVLDERNLIQYTAGNVRPPFTPKWDNKALKALLGAGAIGGNLCEIQTNYYLAVKKPSPAGGEPDGK